VGCVAGGYHARSGAIGCVSAAPCSCVPWGWAGCKIDRDLCICSCLLPKEPPNTCIPSPSAPQLSITQGLSHPSQSPGDGLSREQGSLLSRTPIQSTRAHRGASHLPGTQMTKVGGKHLCSPPAQPPCPAPVFSNNWVSPMGLKPLLKHKGCWGCKTLT